MATLETLVSTLIGWWEWTAIKETVKVTEETLYQWVMVVVVIEIPVTRANAHKVKEHKIAFVIDEEIDKEINKEFKTIVSTTWEVAIKTRIEAVKYQQIALIGWHGKNYNVIQYQLYKDDETIIKQFKIENNKSSWPN